MNTSTKIIKLNFQNEVRRLTVEQKELTMSFLISQVNEKFGQKIGQRKVKLNYVDEEGDKITFDSQSELEELVKERKNSTKALMINIELSIGQTEKGSCQKTQGERFPSGFGCGANYFPQQQPSAQCGVRDPAKNFPSSWTSQTTERTRPDLVQHSQVKCNQCQGKIIGNRFKCISCSDFDLCESCERKERIGEISSHSSSQHLYLLIKTPIILTESLPIRFCSPSSAITPSSSKGWLEDVISQEVREEEIKTIICDGCKNEITTDGERYKCCLCEDYDLCSNCIHSSTQLHDGTHCVWLKLISMSRHNAMVRPSISENYWGRTILSRKGPILVPTREIENLYLWKCRIMNSFPPSSTSSSCSSGSSTPKSSFSSSINRQPSTFCQPKPLSPTFQGCTGFRPHDQNQKPSTTPSTTIPTMDTTDVLMEENESRRVGEEVEETEKKLKELEMMGFLDENTNRSLLKIFNGSLHDAVHYLLKEM